VLLQNLDHPNMGEAFGCAGRERQPHQSPADFPGEATHVCAKYSRRTASPHRLFSTGQGRTIADEHVHRASHGLREQVKTIRLFTLSQTPYEFDVVAIIGTLRP